MIIITCAKEQAQAVKLMLDNYGIRYADHVDTTNRLIGDRKIVCDYLPTSVYKALSILKYVWITEEA